MTNKTKNILLVGGLLLAIILCYKLAIVKTVALNSEYNALKQEEVLFKNIPKQLSVLSQKQKYYDSILSKYELNESSLQNNLLKIINSYSESNSIKVISFLEPHIYNKENLKVKTYQFTLEGEYNSIIKLIHKLEQDTKYGEITNLHFEKKKNFRTGKYYLQANVLLKSFS